MKVYPGVFVSCFLLVCSTPPMGRVPAPHVTLDVEYRPLGEVFDELEKQTGWTIARGCKCGVLQDLMDQTVSIVITDISLRGVIRLMTFPIMRAVAHWTPRIWA